MKTIVCERPHSLTMTTRERPAIQSHEALVKVKRIGICGTDLHAYQGRQPYFTYPRVLGHECSGEIADLGDGAHGLNIGDRVAVIPYLQCGKCIACRQGKTNCCTQLKVIGVHQDGGMCEYLKVPATHLMKTNSISLEQAAIIEPLSIGAHALRRAQMNPGEYTLVIGAGPIGLGVMKLAKLAGGRIIAMDVNEQRLQFCKEWADADHTVNALHDPMQELENITRGDYPPLVFDATGNAQSMNDSFEYVAHGGRLVYVGLVNDHIQFFDPDFHKKEITLLSSRNATHEDFKCVLQHLEEGRIHTNEYITHQCTFDQTISEFESWMRPETGVIKAMVTL